jgi:hypothetical protein
MMVLGSNVGFDGEWLEGEDGRWLRYSYTVGHMEEIKVGNAKMPSASEISESKI